MPQQRWDADRHVRVRAVQGIPKRSQEPSRRTDAMRPRISTSALPTTTPSAIRATVRACEGVDMPNPTATGSEVAARTRRWNRPRSTASAASGTSHTQSRDEVDESLRIVDRRRSRVWPSRGSHQTDQIHATRAVSATRAPDRHRREDP